MSSAHVSSTRAQESHGLRISGYILDDENHQPLKGVSVAAIGDQGSAPATTDNKGLFILELASTVKAGDTVRVKCEKSGYESIDLQSPASSEVPLQYSMHRIKARKSGGAQAKAPAQPDKGTQPPNVVENNNQVTTSPPTAITLGPVSQGPCSNLQVGGSNNQATVNCGPPEPNISWSIDTSQDRVRDGKQLTWVLLTVDHSMEIPAFMATCDRPCKTLGAHAEGFSRMQTDLAIKGYPNWAGFLFAAPRPLGAGVKVYWVIQSLDDQPTQILKIQKVNPSDLPESLR
jgi:hypothetical protein